MTNDGKVACYVVDPHKSLIKTTTSFHKEDVVESVVLWLTEEQLSGPMWFHNSSHAKIKCDAMRERTCRLPIAGERVGKRAGERAGGGGGGEPLATLIVFTNGP